MHSWKCKATFDFLNNKRKQRNNNNNKILLWPFYGWESLTEELDSRNIYWIPVWEKRLLPWGLIFGKHDVLKIGDVSWTIKRLTIHGIRFSDLIICVLITNKKSNIIYHNHNNTLEHNTTIIKQLIGNFNHDANSFVRLPPSLFNRLVGLPPPKFNIQLSNIQHVTNE